MSKMILRRGKPDGFTYETAKGERASYETLGFIRSLVIPPAWTNVEIDPRPGAKIHATGYDEAGRKQYLYSEQYRERQDKKKFDRILSFANALPMMREVTGRHLNHKTLDRQKVLAAMVRLIDLAYFRVGNDRYAEENHTFGLATMRTRHLKVEGDTLVFHYTGKAHKEHTQAIPNATLARVVRELDHLPGYEIFKYYDDRGNLVDVKSDDLNAYIKEIMGADFSAKDFRTWAGTLIAAVALSESGDATECSETQATRNVANAVRRVAAALGNTPSIARASYIDPRVIDLYLSGQSIKSYLSRIDRYLKEHDLLAAEEICVLQLLKQKLKSKQASAS